MKYIYYILIVNLLFSAKLLDIPLTLTQPNGDVFECFTSGDEFYHWLHDSDNYTIVQSKIDGYYYYASDIQGEIIPSDYIANSIDPSSAGLIPNVKISKDEYYQRKNTYWENVQLRDAPSIGTINNINVFIRFADENEFSNSRSWYDIPFNLEEGPSMYHYFKEVSYELLNVHTIHFPECDDSESISYQDEYPRDYYQTYNEVTNPLGYQNDSERTQREHILLKNAIEFISSEVPEDLDVDANNDGYVDNVTFLVKGSPGAWADLLWPHRWALYTEEAYINGARVWDYNMNLEQGGYFTVGTLCHEFFHSLGAPDLYHYYDDVAPVAVGGWDVMDASSDIPQSMTAYMKYRYTDWITELPLISYGGTYELSPLSMSENNIYRINSPLSSNEYFVLEYRVKEGLYEVNTPGGDDGLVIYRVNDNLTGNANGPPDELYVYRTNGTPTSNGVFSGAVFNSEIGRDKFNDNTNPSCFLYDGSAGGINISNIGMPESTIRFDVVNMALIPEYAGISYDSDNDGVINPNEEIIVDLTLTNYSNFNAENISVSISTDVEGIEILNNDLSINSINNNSFETTSININISDDVIGIIPFEVNIIADYYENGQNVNYSDSFIFEIEVSLNQSGFPYSTLNEIHGSPIVCDLNDDGNAEIIFGDHFGNIHSIDSNGNQSLDFNFFPFDTGGQIWGSPICADINSDGLDDIIIVSKSKSIYAFNYDGLLWQNNLNSQLIGTPAMLNIDDNNGLGIAVSGYTNNNDNFFIINSNGQIIDDTIIEEKNKSGFAIADLNENGYDDIVFGTDNNNLYLILDDGTIAPGYPFEANGKFRLGATIVKTSSNHMILAPCENNILYSLDTNGDIIFDYQFNYDISTGISILENNDSFLIFLGLSNGDVVALNPLGELVFNFNISSKVIGSIVFADFNSDDEVDIVAVNEQGSMHIFNLNAEEFIHSPLSYDFPYSSSPMIFDIDNDQDLEIVVGSTNSIITIDMKDFGIIDRYWNIFSSNNYRNNYYQISLDCNLGDLDFDGLTNVLDVVLLVECILSDGCTYCADLNNDGLVNIQDIISLINIIFY